MTETHSEISLGCQCGKVTGVIANEPKVTVNHISCYCIDCRTFSNYLDADSVTLDEHHGSAIIQTSPATVKINSGAEHLKCLRLGPKGISRWYTGCCNTPVANTLANGKIPFAGVIRAFVKTDNVERIVGPVKYRVFASLSPGANGHKKAPFGLMVKILTNMLRWKLRGDHKHSPFFDGVTGTPISEPTLLTREQRKAATPTTA